MQSMCKCRDIKDINVNEDMFTWQLEHTGLNRVTFKSTADMLRHKKHIFHSQQVWGGFDPEGKQHKRTDSLLSLGKMRQFLS